MTGPPEPADDQPPAQPPPFTVRRSYLRRPLIAMTQPHDPELGVTTDDDHATP